MASTADIRNGLMIRFNHDIYEVVEFLHVKPGKGNAFVRTKLKSATSGKVLDNTFPSGAKLEEVSVERRKYQYLYPEGTDLVFMHNQTFEQITVPKGRIEGVEYLLESMESDFLFNVDDESIIKVEIPNFVIQKVTYTEPGIKGDTATNVYKPATIESGAQVKVPLFVNIDDVIKVDTRTGEYLERAK